MKLDNELKINILLISMSGAGRTSILNRLSNKQSDSTPKNVETKNNVNTSFRRPEFAKKEISYFQHKICYHFMSIRRDRSISDSHGAHCILLIFDISKPNVIDDIRNLLPAISIIKQKVVLVANKIDISNEICEKNKMTIKQFLSTEKYLINKYLEISALTGQGFEWLIEHVFSTEMTNYLRSEKLIK